MKYIWPSIQLGSGWIVLILVSALYGIMLVGASIHDAIHPPAPHADT